MDWDNFALFGHFYIATPFIVLLSFGLLYCLATLQFGNVIGYGIAICLLGMQPIMFIADNADRFKNLPFSFYGPYLLLLIFITPWTVFNLYMFFKQAAEVYRERSYININATIFRALMLLTLLALYYISGRTLLRYW